MIADDTNKKLIGTPTKTGTTSIENMVRKVENKDFGLRLVRNAPTKIPRHHHMIVPRDCRHYRRYLTVRHPLDRLVSLYTYLQKEPYQWKSRAAEFTEMDFAEFADWIIGLREELGFKAPGTNLLGMGAEDFKFWRSPNIWLVSQSECAWMFRPHRFIHLERIERDLAKVRPLDEWGGPILHRNRTRPEDAPKTWKKWYDGKTKRKVLRAWAEKDCELGGYSV